MTEAEISKVKTWGEFVEACEKRVDLDNEQLGIESEYVPQAKICSKPDFCLVAMEPGKIRNKKNWKWQKEKGYKAFNNWHVNYCAYHYLCGGKFKYHITDLAKGAMPIKIARKTQTERYKNWLPLFKKELELLGNPKVIAIGKTVYDDMKKLGFKADYCILHYSKGNPWIAKEYDSIKKKFPEPTENEWRTFVKKLMKDYCGWDEKLIETRDNRQWKKEFPQISDEFNHKGQKKLFTVYGSKFKELAKK